MSSASTPILPVVLAGGSGTRLWPLSRPDTPKQFLRLTSAYSLFQETCLRLKDLENAMAPLVVTNQSHADQTTRQLSEIRCGASSVILEPSARNTAPAIAVAALRAFQLHPDPILLVMPADHVILNPSAFLKAVHSATAAARAGWLITFGIVPDAPKTGYGYIEQGEEIGEIGEIGEIEVTETPGISSLFRVQRFVEKPDEARAKAFLASGKHYWNSGIFLFRAKTVLDELAEHQPDVLGACQEAMAGVREEDGLLYPAETAFKASPAVSIDYAVMEKTRHAAVVPVAMGWNDVGSWQALWEIGLKDPQDNVVQGISPEQVILDETTGAFVLGNGLNQSRKCVVVIGLSDIMVIDTDEALLLVRRGMDQQVRHAAERMEQMTRRRDMVGPFSVPFPAPVQAPGEWQGSRE